MQHEGGGCSGWSINPPFALLVLPESLWRNGIARWTSNPEAPGSSPGRDDRGCGIFGNVTSEKKNIAMCATLFIALGDGNYQTGEKALYEACLFKICDGY